jgi:hypothetical protein
MGIKLSVKKNEMTGDEVEIEDEMTCRGLTFWLQIQTVVLILGMAVCRDTDVHVCRLSNWVEELIKTYFI